MSPSITPPLSLKRGCAVRQFMPIGDLVDEPGAWMAHCALPRERRSSSAIRGAAQARMGPRGLACPRRGSPIATIEPSNAFRLWR